MSDPVSRTILLLDIERYSDRDDVEQAYLRRMLYDITDRTLESAGIDETRRLRADRGDSVMELIDASASVTALLRALLTEVPARLRAVNRMASSSAQIRLRGVVAAGYVAVDGHDGWVGSDLNHACRLLDADVLRAALRERPGDFALCVSESLHAGVVRHDHPGVPADEFHQVTVASKNGPLKAWLYGPVPQGAGPKDHGDTGAGQARGGSGDRPAPPAPNPAAHGERDPARRAHDEQGHAPDAHEERIPSQGTHGERDPARRAHEEQGHAPGAREDRVPAQGTHDERDPARGAHEEQGHTPASHEHRDPARRAHDEQGHAPAAHEERVPAQGDSPEERVPRQGGSPENRPAPDGTRGAPAPGAVFNFHGGSPSFGGSLVGGDQHGVSGGQVTGDVHLGGSERGEGA